MADRTGLPCPECEGTGDLAGCAACGHTGEEWVEWYSRHPPPTGLDQYLHLVRSDSDPPERVNRGIGNPDPSPHRTAGKTPQRVWAARLLAHFEDGEPRTWNRACIELTGRTADVMFTTPLNAALWDLVQRGHLEHCAQAPVLFRLVLNRSPP